MSGNSKERGDWRSSDTSWELRRSRPTVIDGTGISGRQNYAATLFCAEGREAVRAEGLAVRPAKGTALVHQPQSITCGVRPNGLKVLLIAIPSELADRTHRIEDEGLARWTVHQRKK